MVNKLVGYISFAAGALAIALSYPSIRSALKIPIPSIPVSDNIMMIVGAGLMVVGALISFKGASSKKQPAEVPIYEGQGKKRTIVGIQRLGK